MVLPIVRAVFIVENNNMKNLILSKNFLIAIAVILVVVPIVLFTKNFFSNKSEGDKNISVISGLLLINTDKSKSIPGEKVSIQITSLDGDGKTLCDSNLKLEIIKDNEVISEPDISNISSCTPRGQPVPLRLLSRPVFLCSIGYIKALQLIPNLLPLQHHMRSKGT